ncbi:hypothetical protein V2605_03425 [Tenacibaculum maritimum]|uniref:hypothetical protein n=1 Tax=Tenacibaculum maritimum TaxID=107401 RepID=UPI0012E6782B|nr:hypothetical protein [Tenacibaculum maritimum]CAA0254914.1 conserved hypothetical protein [Tenacibaculum maritimum]
MNRDNFQSNLKYFLTKTKNGKQYYKIVDGTAETLNEAHTFFEGSVPIGKTEKETIDSMNENYCDWLAKNRNVIAKFYEDKNV